MAGADDDLRRALLEQSDVLMYAFDLEPLAAPRVPEHIKALEVEVQVFACDATGGVYLECQNTPNWVIHVDARGYAHVLAESVQEALALIVALPYWREILTEPWGHELSAMRETAARLESEVCDDIPTLPAAREYLRRELRLPPVDDPVAALRRLAVAEPPNITIVGADGVLLSPDPRASALHSAV